MHVGKPLAVTMPTVQACPWFSVFAARSTVSLPFPGAHLLVQSCCVTFDAHMKHCRSSPWAVVLVLDTTVPELLFAASSCPSCCSKTFTRSRSSLSSDSCPSFGVSFAAVAVDMGEWACTAVVGCVSTRWVRPRGPDQSHVQPCIGLLVCWTSGLVFTMPASLST